MAESLNPLNIFKFLKPQECFHISEVCPSWKSAASLLWNNVSAIVRLKVDENRRRDDMATLLNEYCLYEIFKLLTPREWILVSEVCPSWKNAASRLWRSVSIVRLISDGYYISDSGYSPDFIDTKKYKPITIDDATNMLIQAAPFVENLVIAIDKEEFTTFLIELGSFCYRVTGSNVQRKYEDTLKLLAEIADELTEIQFKMPTSESHAEATITLFNRNQIKKLLAHETILNEMCTNHQTDGIEDLVCYLFNVVDLIPFHGHFPHLQTLAIHINITCYTRNQVRECAFAQILPYVKKVKNFKLTVFSHNNDILDLASGVYDDIFELTQLEELELEVEPYCTVVSWEIFLETLALRLPQLQVVRIDSVGLSVCSIKSLLRLPHLRILFVNVNKDFREEDFPELGNLSECKLGLEFASVDDQQRLGVDVARMITKMPNLKCLSLSFRFRYFPQMTDIIHAVIDCLARQDKQIVIAFENQRKQRRPFNQGKQFPKKLKVERKSGYNDSRKLQIFNIIILNTWILSDEYLFKVLNKSLNENMKDHHVFI